MIRIAFLLDEHVPPAIGNAIVALEPTVVVRTVGINPDVPPKGTPDAELLTFAEKERFALVTFDKTTMPIHILAHLSAGRQTWGAFIVPSGNKLSAGRIASDLVAVWGASQAEEWVDQTVFLPL